MVVKTPKRRSNKIYNSELSMTKIYNQVKCKCRVDPQRTQLTIIAELTWSNLGLIRVLKKFKRYLININDINILDSVY